MVIVAGVALQCRLSGSEEWPQVVPVACIIGNETNRNEFVGLSNGCYETFGSTVYYCSITGKVDVSRLENNRLNGTWRYNWQLSWNSTSDDVSWRGIMVSALVSLAARVRFSAAPFFFFSR